MKYVSVVMLSMILAFVAATAGAQEPSQGEAVQDDGSVTGTFHRVIEDYDQLVMNDDIYALEQTVWVDGTKYPADRVKELLHEGDAIKLVLSGARKGGYQVVTRIRTNP